ncbi:hypothetical protein ACFSJQ_19265 [Vibrio olivae]
MLNNSQSVGEKDTIRETSYRSFEKAFSLSAGVRGRYGAFSGSISSEFSQKERTEKTTHFLSINVMCQYATLSIDNYLSKASFQSLMTH